MRRPALQQILNCARPPASLAAAAGTGLDQQRIADPVGFCLQEVAPLLPAVISGNKRYARCSHYLFGGTLRTHGANGLTGWPDEDYSGLGACLGESSVFGEKTVTWVYRPRAAPNSHLQNDITQQIALAGRRRADMVGFISQGNMECVGISIGIDRYSPYAKSLGGTNDATGNFTTVGNQYFIEHAGVLYIVIVRSE